MAKDSQKGAIKKIGDALKGPGAHLGDVVWLSLNDVRVKRDALRAAFVAQSLPEHMAPEDPTPEAAFGRAVGAYREKSSGLFLRRAEANTKGGDVLVVKQKGDEFTPCARVGVDGNGALTVAGNGKKAEAEPAIALLQQLYDEHRDHALGPEVSAAAIRTILNWCGGIRLRDRGNVYWVHREGAAELRALGSIIDTLGGSYLSVLPVHDSTVYVCGKHGASVSPEPGKCSVCGAELVATQEARGAVSRAATESFTSELDGIFKELEAFNAKGGKPRPATLERRLEEFEDLRSRVDLYADVLEAKRGGLVARLDQAKDQVRTMLATI